MFFFILYFHHVVYQYPHHTKGRMISHVYSPSHIIEVIQDIPQQNTL